MRLSWHAWQKWLNRLVRSNGARRRAGRPLSVEPVEARRVMAADLVITGVSADGTNLQVTYDVAGENAAAFDIGIYQSPDGVTLGPLLMTQRLTESGKLAVGTGHTESIAPNFNDPPTDYFLVARLDSASEIAESSEANNQRALDGGVFTTAGGIVHVHGTAGADTISMTKPGAVDVALNGVTYTYNASAVSAVHVRSHAGNDAASATTGFDRPVRIYGGDGDDALAGGDANDYLSGGYGGDALHGGYGDDALYGGDGNDTLYGNVGNDSLYGEGGADQLHTGAAAGYGGYSGYGGYGGYGDAVFGGDGDDSLYGDGGADVLRGDGGNDNIYLGAADDAGYGGYGNDALWGGDGADALYGEEGDDSLFGETGADLLFGGAGNDVLSGGGGADQLTGGTGVDTINGGGESGDTDADHPVIRNFVGVSLGGALWLFSGTVEDDDSLAGLSVSFGGLFSVSIAIGANGTFAVTRLLPLNPTGTVTVSVTDREGLSDSAEFIVG